MEYFLLAFTAVLLAVAQILQKLASRRVAGAIAPLQAIGMLLRSVEFWLAALLLGIALLAWLVTLSEFEVSKAYPLLGVSYGIAAVLARMILTEELRRNRWMGIGLISVGAAIMMAG